jgi:hypothetical protein
MKPSLSTIAYTSFRDLHKRDVILAHPFDLEVYPIWVGKMHSEVVKMGMMSIIEWCMFIGGWYAKKEHTTM